MKSGNWVVILCSGFFIRKLRTKKDEILDEETESKTTWKKGFIAVGFFTTLENALKAYIDAKLRKICC